MKKTRAVDEEIVEHDILCKECGDSVFICANLLCENDLNDGDVIYCQKTKKFDVRKHFCNECGKKKNKRRVKK